MTKPPPPRYKIVERNGRLITIDTWAKKGEPLPTGSLAQPPLQPRRRDVASGGGIGEALVAAVLRVRDDHGRRLLTTSSQWDRKGPRVIALSDKGEQRVGAVLLAGCLALIALLIAAIVDLDLLLPLIVVTVAVAGATSSARTGLVTRFLDGLGEGITR